MLKIKNIGKIVGMYANGREIIEAGDYKIPRPDGSEYFVFKIGKQSDGEEQKWMHILNYPNCPLHKVSLEFFGNFKNAIETFEMALKEVK